MRILVTGATGQLGTYVLDRLVGSRHLVQGWSRSTSGERSGIAVSCMELIDEREVTNALDAFDPECIVHTAALSAVEAVRRDPALGQAINVEATRVLAEWCRRHDCRLLYTSTDLVFDGERSWYSEQDVVRPTLEYGRTKAEAERFVREVLGGLVARISLLFGPSRNGRPTFFDQCFSALRRGNPQSFFEDEFRTPLDMETAADILVRLVEAGCAGVVHVGGTERITRYALMRLAAEVAGIDPALVIANKRCDVELPEPRPADVSLDTSRLASILVGLQRPSIAEALRRIGKTYDSNGETCETREGGSVYS